MATFTVTWVGVSALDMARLVRMAAKAGIGEPTIGMEKTTVDVFISDVGANKIQAIRAVRELTGLGLKEAKDLVEGDVRGVGLGLKQDVAAKFRERLIEAGCSVRFQ